VKPEPNSLSRSLAGTRLVPQTPRSCSPTPRLCRRLPGCDGSSETAPVCGSQRFFLLHQSTTRLQNRSSRRANGPYDMKLKPPVTPLACASVAPAAETDVMPISVRLGTGLDCCRHGHGICCPHRVGAGGRVVSCFNVRCILSWRPFCCGRPGSISSGWMPGGSTTPTTDSAEPALWWRTVSRCPYG